MDRYLEAFDAAEQARIQDNNEEAVRLYEEAAALTDESSAFDPVALHHMWGLALTSIGEYRTADFHYATALDHTNDTVKVRAITRDAARNALLSGDFATAHDLIESATGNAISDMAERGASLGLKARILLAEGKALGSTPEGEPILPGYIRGEIMEALEIFGMADVLLQRSGNHRYELYNLLHFMEALVEYRLPFPDDNWAEVEFAEAQTPRLRALADTYGGPPHQERAANIVVHIFAERER